MHKMFVWAIAVVALLLTILVLTVRVSRRLIDNAVVTALRRGDIKEARALMEKAHDPMWIGIQCMGQPAAQEAALDVQFECYYSSETDSNITYPENIPSIKALVGAGARPEFRHMLRAAQQGKMRCVDYFVSLGVPIDSPESPDTVLANVAYWGDATLLQRLIDAGAKQTPLPGNGWTPLLAAAWSGQIDCVKLLLEHGADPEVPYQKWEGHWSPTWKVIKERAEGISPPADFVAVWTLVDRYRNSRPPATSNHTQPSPPGE